MVSDYQTALAVLGPDSEQASDQITKIQSEVGHQVSVAEVVSSEVAAQR